MEQKSENKHRFEAFVQLKALRSEADLKVQRGSSYAFSDLIAPCKCVCHGGSGPFLTSLQVILLQLSITKIMTCPKF